MKELLPAAAFALLALLVLGGDRAACAADAVPAVQAAHYVPLSRGSAPSEGRDEASFVITVLEKRIGSSRMPVQARQKLLVMGRDDLHLIASLCDRIEASGDRPGADVALLLAAALIVLS